MTRRQLISSDEAVKAKCQHKAPCSDCPWSRQSLNGWLGGASIDAWLHRAHGDDVVDCHTLRGAQCAGIAIYRRNVCKRSHPINLVLPKDEVAVFSTPMEFRAHHEQLPKPRSKS